MAATFMVGAQLSIAMVHNRKLCALVLQVPVFYGDMAGEVWGHAQPLILRPCKLYVSHAVSLLQPPALPCLALALGSGVKSRVLHELGGQQQLPVSQAVSCPAYQVLHEQCVSLVLDEQDTGMWSVTRPRKAHCYGAWVTRQLGSATGSLYVARVCPAPCLCETALLDLSKVVLRGLRYTQRDVCSRHVRSPMLQSAAWQQHLFGGYQIHQNLSLITGLWSPKLYRPQAWLIHVSTGRAAPDPNRDT